MKNKVKNAWNFIKETISEMFTDWKRACWEFYMKCPITAAFAVTSTIFYVIISMTFNIMDRKGYDFEWVKK